MFGSVRIFSFAGRGFSLFAACGFSLFVASGIIFFLQRAIIIIIIMTLFKCQMYLARTALIGDTFQIELEFRNANFFICRERV